MTITVENLVAREVHYCVSYLVSTLAGGYGSIENTERLHSRGREAQAALSEAVEQAFELCSPLDDWDDAQIEAKAKAKGYLIVESQEHVGTFEWVLIENGEETDREGYFSTMQEALEAICGGADIEPYQREVYEHWIVSEWLADRLAEKGEKVDKDFAGLIVWARTTTGQGIASDSVIEAIHADLVREA